MSKVLERRFPASRETQEKVRHVLEEARDQAQTAEVREVLTQESNDIEH